tara:strand:+ start:1004 stop:1675 length:672 start_codon:yes stop_codon:yes gene_type:complete
MNTETPKNPILKLVAIQKDLKAPKNQFNSFGKYNYRSCEDILEAVKPLCHAAGVVLTLTDEVVQVGSWVYVKAIASVQDESGAFSTVAYAREPAERKGMDASQITGSASSYARKYALNGLFCIDDAKDADTQERPPAPAQKPYAAPQPQQAAPPQQPPANDGLRKAFHATGTELYGAGWDAKRAELCAHYGVESSNDMTAQTISNLITRMKEKLAATPAGNGG